MAFEISRRRDPDAPATLLGQIDAELRARIEEAVDYVCLDVMVAARQQRGLPAPVADSQPDREEFTAIVQTFLERLREALLPALPGAGRESAVERPADVGDLVATQVALAKVLPDYWQRFESVRAAYAAERRVSGRQRGGLIRRLLGGG